MNAPSTLTTACTCEGALHRVNCWWCVDNDDGRYQATGDPEIDAESEDEYLAYHEGCESCHAGDPLPHAVIRLEEDSRWDLA